jgi:tetratricopeptide (TPR) repeat protein
METAPHYWAFLSYSHSDRKWADWLHRALEHYRVPKGLVGRTTSAGPVPERLAPVFRDREELAASDDLGGKIRTALAASKYLIVLCSPAAATSRWTNEEIATFKRLLPEGRVLAAIVSGEPFASGMAGRETEECFPRALRHRLGADGEPTDEPAEPIAADLRESGDGKRMGLLKLIAGMLGVGLDELVRREANRRQKRLAWLAAASLGGMVVTSGLAVAAVQGRNEAERQRGEAEGLIGFMLGDLRAKLEPLGRLDVLDSVGGKALQYYQKQDKGSLTDESLAQRARALTLMGEIANRRGDLDGALKLYTEALAGTEEALRRAPADGQRIYYHAQNVYWVGYIAWQRDEAGEAERQFTEYKRLAGRLIALDPNDSKWRLEGVYADTNLGLLLLQTRRFKPAESVFYSALRASESLAAAAPRDPAYQNQLLESLANLADAQEDNGRLEQAMRSRERQLNVLARLSAADGSNARLKRKAMTAHRAMGRLFASRGEIGAGLTHLRASTALADELVQTEPSNTEWLQWVARTYLDLGELLLVGNRADEAGAASRTACDVAEQLVRREPSVVAWRTGVLRPCLVLRAQLAAKRGSAAEALAIASQALAISQPAQGMEDDLFRHRYAIAAAHMLAGDQYSAMGERGAAQHAWRRAFAALPANVPESPAEQAQRYDLLRKLARPDEAARLGEQLDAIGYRHPVYVRARSRA